MNHTPRPHSWVRAVLVIGIVYFLVGIVFAAPGTHVRIWRLAAWIASAAVYAAHIRYEHFLLRNSPRFLALHAALAVAIGAFGLAVAATVHSLLAATGNLHRLLLALVLWPLITALPAFLVALAAGALLARLPRRA